MGDNAEDRLRSDPEFATECQGFFGTAPAANGLTGKFWVAFVTPQSAWEAFERVQAHVNSVGMVAPQTDADLKVLELFIRAALKQK